MDSEDYNNYVVVLTSNGKKTYIVNVEKIPILKEEYLREIDNGEHLIDLDLDSNPDGKDRETLIKEGVSKLKEWLKANEDINREQLLQQTNGDDTMIGGKYKNSKLMKTKKYKGGYRLRRSKKNRK
jgi:hypothetical protein